MVSLDPPERSRAFALSVDSNFPVLSDVDKRAAMAYGVLAFGGLFAKRWTFYISQDGIIREVDRSVRPAKAGADVARKLAELGFRRKA